MADPFVAEIRIFGFNFAPTGWAFCNGQILPISQNTALFSLLGTTYGGDGKSTFALPDLQGCAPMNLGQGPGLSQHFLGESGGTETVTLLESEIPSHSHALNASQADSASRIPVGDLPATGIGIGIYAPSGSLTPMSPNTLSTAGGSLPHNNMMPYLTANFCIALQGIFPPRG
ncbi:MAG: phage tail protein [Verrucomicrobiaceae bacterium]|nr:phage tail protein [Verrucomicrobiaceae bacterium]